MELSCQEWKSKNKEHAKLLLLHGLGGSGALWRPIAMALEENFSILAPDQRGHGKSLVHNLAQSGFHPSDYAQDVLETMTKRAFHPIYVVGHSMGVRTACALAQLNSDWILGLVLVDLGLSADQGGGFGKKLASFLNEMPETFPNIEAARDFMRDRSPDPSISQYLLAVMRVGSEKRAGPLSLPFQREALQKTLASIRGVSIEPWVRHFATTTHKPVLILRGENSTVWSHAEFEEAQRSFQRMPNVQFIEIPGTGHGLPFEKRQIFCDLLVQFISRAQKSD